MSDSYKVTALSPVLRLALHVCTALDLSIDEALALLEPFCFVDDEGLKRIREDADIPPDLLRAMMNRA